MFGSPPILVQVDCGRTVQSFGVFLKIAIHSAKALAVPLTKAAAEARRLSSWAALSGLGLVGPPICSIVIRPGTSDFRSKWVSRTISMLESGASGSQLPGWGL